MAEQFGAPFAAEKHQAMSSSADFLGLQHDFKDTHLCGAVRFWVRERLQNKVQDMMSSVFSEGRLLPGVASKLFGSLTFLNTGCYGKLGRSGLNAIKERQYSNEFVVASDAAQDAVREGSAGALFVLPDGQRRALVMKVPSTLFDLWSDDDAKIAQLELAVVLMTLAFMAFPSWTSWHLVGGQHRCVDGPGAWAEQR
eukprot:s121_g35.t1